MIVVVVVVVVGKQCRKWSCNVLHIPNPMRENGVGVTTASSAVWPGALSEANSATRSQELRQSIADTGSQLAHGYRRILQKCRKCIWLSTI